MLLDERVQISPISPVGSGFPSGPRMIISTPGSGLPAERIRWLPSTEWSSGGRTQIVPVVSVIP